MIKNSMQTAKYICNALGFNSWLSRTKSITSTFNGIMAASIIFVSSMAADSGSIGNGVYSASKGALISYMNCLMLELAPRQIRVNAICPAMVWTDLILKDGLDENELKKDEQNYPLKRYGKPEDVANLAIYLLSDASSWMTGSSIKLTGGGR